MSSVTNSGSTRARRRAWIVPAVAAASLGILVPAAQAGPAQAAEKIECTGSGFKCDRTGYSSHAAMSHWNMAPGHNCTNYVAYRLIRAGMSPKVGYLHNAGAWAGEARRHHFLVDDVPTPGSVAHWYYGAGGVSSAGHVAIVQEVGPNSITVAEDNYSSGPMRVRTISANDPSWPSNFLHFDQRTDRAPDEIDPPQTPLPALFSPVVWIENALD